MYPGFDNCGLAGCDRPLNMHRVSCPICLDVPYDDIFSTRSNYGYCCVRHLFAGQYAHAQECRIRVLWRSLLRIADIYNMLFMCYRTTLFLHQVLNERTDHEGDLEIFLGPSRLLGKDWWDPETTSLHGILGVLSFDWCRGSIALLSPVLIWLLQGRVTPNSIVISKLTSGVGLSVRIEEKVLQPMPKLSKQWVYSWLHRPYKIASHHYVVTITPLLPSSTPLQSLTLDASSMQYGRRIKSHRTSQYTVKRIQPWTSETKAFGYTYKEWAGTDTVTKRDIKESQGFRLTHIAARTMKGTVWREVRRLGGREKLLQMGHLEFIRARDRMGRVVCGKLRQLRPDFEEIVAARGLLDFKLEQMLAVPDGPGHVEMTNALEPYL